MCSGLLWLRRPRRFPGAFGAGELNAVRGDRFNYAARNIYQDPITVDRVLYVLPILGSVAANPRDMSAFESSIPCKLRQVGTQALVDQELH